MFEIHYFLLDSVDPNTCNPLFIGISIDSTISKAAFCDAIQFVENYIKQQHDLYVSTVDNNPSFNLNQLDQSKALEQKLLLNPNSDTSKSKDPKLVTIWCWQFKFRLFVRNAIHLYISNCNTKVPNKSNITNSKMSALQPPNVIYQILEKSYRFHQSRMEMFEKSEWWSHLETMIGEEFWNKLMDFQKYAVAFGIFAKGLLLLCDSMGLGKTYQTLCVVQYFINSYYRNNPHFNSVLIVCPASVRFNWESELVKFGFTKPDNEKAILICHNGDILKTLSAEQILRYQYVIVSFSLLELLNKQFTSPINNSNATNGNNNNNNAFPQIKSFHTIIIDESENIMNDQTNRYKSLQWFFRYANHKILCSGTPLYRTRQLFAQLHCIQPALFSNFYTFAERYCDPKSKYVPGKGYITTYDGFSHLEELSAILKMTIFIRRTQDQVLKCLPKKTRICVYLDKILPKRKTKITENSDNNCDRINRIDTIRKKGSKSETDPELTSHFQSDSESMEESDMKKELEHLEELKELEELEELKELEELEELPDDDAKNLRFNKVDKQEITISKSIFRQLYNNSRRKLPAVVQYLNDWWLTTGSKFPQSDNHNKVILFTSYRVMMNGLEKMVQNWTFHANPVQYIKICGSTPSLHRASLVYQFNHELNTRVAIIMIRSGGAGLNLTEANYEFMTEIDPTCSKNLQAESRAHRLGQKSPVFVYYLLINEPLENRFWKNVCQQSENCSSILNGQSVASKSVNESSRIFAHQTVQLLSI